MHSGRKNTYSNPKVWVNLILSRKRILRASSFKRIHGWIQSTKKATFISKKPFILFAASWSRSYKQHQRTWSPKIQEKTKTISCTPQHYRRTTYLWCTYNYWVRKITTQKHLWYRWKCIYKIAKRGTEKFVKN